MKKFNLQERLINFAVQSIKHLEQLPVNVVNTHLKKQIIRSSSSPALNYAEACDAESRADFMHKIKVVLKELRETYVGMKILYSLNTDPSFNFETVLKECNELIAILKKSYTTAKLNMKKK